MTDTPPNVPIRPARRSFLERVSIVWIIPLAALVIALSVAWQSYADRGPLIEITFENASGIVSGQTELRYRDVAVGVVESITFTENLHRVLVAVRVDNSVADYIDQDAQFYVVRPEISSRGVSGLETVLSGVYIDGIWNEEAQGLVTRHEGSDDTPLMAGDRGGLVIRLKATPDAGLTEKAPIVYQGIEVGRIGKATITDDGVTVEAEAVIFAPHGRLINTSTRFWDASGFSFSLGPSGARIDFSSVASLVSGGVTFRTVVSGGEPAQPGESFLVYADEGAARSSVFSDEEGPALDLTAVFEDNVSGLAVDAPVDLGGVRIGRVTALSGIVDPDQYGDNRVRLAATLSINPSRLGIEGSEVGTDSALNFLAGRVDEGLRARLATASLLAGGLKVELVMVDDPADPEAVLNREVSPNPRIPTTDSDISDVSATAEGVFERINNLPIEELLQSAIGLMDNISRVAGSPDLRALPTDLRGTVSDLRAFIGSEDLQRLPGRIDGIANEIDTLLARLNEEDAVTRILDAVDAAKEAVSEASTAVSDSVSGLPALTERLTAVAAKAENVPLEQLSEDLSALMQSTTAVLDTDGARALPEDLGDALNELQAVLKELREGGVVDNLNATFDSAREASDTLRDVARQLPSLLDRAKSVLAQAGTTVQGYDADRGVGRDLATALREVERAAAAVSSLARALERNPNSLLFGR